MPSPARCIRLALLALLAVGAHAGAVADVVDDPAFPRAETLFPQLEPILIEALNRAPRMLSEDLTLLESSYNRDAERALLYPRMGGYAQINQQREGRVSDDTAADPDDNPDESSKNVLKTYYSASINQPLFHWGALKAQADIARIRYQIARRNYREAYQVLANEIRDAYLRLVVGRIAQRNRRFELEKMKSDLEVTKQKVAEGRLTSDATSSAELAIENVTLVGDRADFALERSLEQFLRLTGTEGLTLEQIPEMIPAPEPVQSATSLPVRTEYVTQRGFETNLRYFGAKRDLESQRLALRMTRSTLRPKFDLVAGVSQDEVDRTGNVAEKYQLQTTYFGLNVNWAIFDSGRTRAFARAARSRIRRAEMNLGQIEKDVIALVEQYEKELGFSTRSLNIAERGFASAEGTYTTAVRLEKEGRASKQSIDDARAAVRAAEYSICETRRLYLRTVADFLSVVEADPLLDKVLGDVLVAR